MRRCLLLLLVVLAQRSSAQPLPPGAPAVVITEILYNLPQTDQALQFIEVTNPSDLNERGLSGYRFTEGVEFSFPTGLIAQPNQSFIVAKDSVAFENAFGIPAFQWTAGGELDNMGEKLVLRDNFNQIADSLTYSNDAPWPLAAVGTSIVLCNDTSDGSDPLNWSLATNNTGITVGGILIYANPAEPCSVDNGISQGVGPSFRLFPNPSTGTVYVEPPYRNENATLRIVSMTGKTVHSQTVDGGTWIHAELPPGIYIVQCMQRSGLRSARLIVGR